MRQQNVQITLETDGHLFESMKREALGKLREPTAFSCNCGGAFR
jgi:hypothetical protein